MTHNLALLTDSYKCSHWKQYPPQTQTVYSYLESRGGRSRQTVFFGLQYLLMQYLSTPVTADDVQEAADVYEQHLGPGIFNEDGWNRLVNRHGGRLPIRIKAVREGSVVDVSNVLMTVENTDPDFYWPTNYIESLLVQVWYPCSVATLSYEIRQTIRQYLELTGSVEGLDFKLHDFGFRGSTSTESAALGGLAHLTSFKGSDTVPALVAARKFYREDMAGFSIPAAEHSTITSWGEKNEAAAYRNMITQFPGMVAVVSDSYDIYRACDELWGQQLKDMVVSRENAVVIRPDSGDPTKVIPSILNILKHRFGATLNAKGYYVLPPCVRVIQGDGIDHNMVREILRVMKQEGFSADNIAFGSGGGLLQSVNRDTHKFAFKASAIQVDNTWREVYKKPITDSGKNSKRGKLTLTKTASGRYRTVESAPNLPDELVTVFENGYITQTYSLADVRARIVAASNAAKNDK